MNKFMTVLTVAAVATFTGCKDPGYKRSTSGAEEARVIATDVETTPAPAAPADKPEIVVTEKECLCPPGTKHSEPCKCGSAKCKCIVETKKAPLPVAAASSGVYVVRSGDYLAKISKKFNVTIVAIKNANNLKSDMIRVGQKLKIPGVSDTEISAAQKSEPAPKAPVAVKPAQKKFAAYSGATKEYVVKSGDTLGAIAYGNGINIRQLKAMNSLTSDALKVGQKLKIPAVPVQKAKKSVKAPDAEAKKDTDKKVGEEASPTPSPAPVEDEKKPVVEDTASPAPASASAPADDTFTYKVLEGEDITAVTIRWGVSAAKIRELNNLAEDAQLTPGQVIKLPSEVQQ